MSDQEALDITDLDQARRVIASLRRSVDELIAISEPAENEFSVFLDQEHADMLRTLYMSRRLIDDQEEDEELNDALTMFVSNWLEVQNDTVRMDQEHDARMLIRKLRPKKPRKE